MTPALLAALRAARTERRAVVLATRLDGGEQLLLDPADPRAECERALLAEIDAVGGDGKPRTVAIDGAEWFIEPMLPSPRLLMVGAGHVAQVLAPMATLAGLAPTVIDPRSAFATVERFPGTALLAEWPDAALDRLGPDNTTAIALLTHDPKLDDPAIGSALRSDAFFIGVLGSTRTHAARLARLREAGHDDRALARLRGPIGLPLGGRAPEEIAVAILAEIVAVRHGASIAHARQR